MVIVALLMCAAGYVWVWCVCDSQADQIEAMSREMDRLRHAADFWPAMLRAELIALEMRLRAWMESRNGAEGERKR